MSTQFVVVASLLGLTVSVAVADLVHRRPRRRLPTVLLAALTVAVYVAGRPDGVEAKGGAAEVASVALCYAAMLMGMAGEYFYSQAERGGTLRFEAATFLMPIFASPIVFIPLLTLTTDVAQDGVLGDGKLMVYLVAFQNGFFWKGFFEQRRAQAQSKAADTRAPEAVLQVV